MNLPVSKEECKRHSLLLVEFKNVATADITTSTFKYTNIKYTNIMKYTRNLAY